MQEIMDQSSTKQPQISEMFQKFALAFKTKTIEFFAEDDLDPDLDLSSAAAATAYEDSDGFALLDSAEEIITDQKVVVIKPDHTHNLSECQHQSSSPQQKPEQEQEQEQAKKPTVKTRTQQARPINTHIAHTLISSLFANISSFEASYLQFQTAHVPFVEETLVSADRTAVSHLRKLSEFKQFYNDLIYDPELDGDYSIGSCLEAHVQENQSKLRALETVSNRLQSEIDVKDAEVLALRQELDKIKKANTKLSKRLSQNPNSSVEVLLSVKVFDSVLRDAFRSIHRFTKLLIDLMKKANWDLDLAANSVHSDIDYAKKGHNQYAFLSYVCLVMFRDFHSEGFGLSVNETTVCNGNGLNSCKSNSMRQLVEHVSCSPIELLNRNPNCEFSKFCENKYQELIHPTMESSIFSNLDQNEAVLNSWRSLSVFYKSFINMASSVWTLHKLAFSFDPVVEIFQVDRGVEFSMIYMEDITKRSILPGRTRAKVGFTVVPGFKIGRTVIQSQVYLTGLKCTE